MRNSNCNIVLKMLSYLVLRSWLEASHFLLSCFSPHSNHLRYGVSVQGCYTLTWIVPDNKDPLPRTCRDDVNWAVLTLLPRYCPSFPTRPGSCPWLRLPFPATHSLLCRETLRGLLFLPRALGVTKMGGSFWFFSLDPSLASLYFSQNDVVKTQTS